MIEPGVIHITRSVPHPPGRIWQALTDPKLHAQWWAPGNVSPVIGHRFTLDMYARWGMQDLEVLAAAPGRLLCYAFGPGTLDTTLTWHNEPAPAGARVVLEHRGFDLASPVGRAACEDLRDYWHDALARLEAVVARPDPAPVPTRASP
jgi:uncharacterized protein YndB with AHSA1/START domain